jgi:Na+/H+ antiporter NhaA
MNENIKKSIQTIALTSFITMCVLLLWQPLCVVNMRQSDIENRKVFDLYKLLAISLLCGTVIGMIMFINDIKTFRENEDEDFVEEVVIEEKIPSEKKAFNFSSNECDFY